MQSNRHPVFDVGEHRRYLLHPHNRVHPVEGRGAPEQRMRRAESLAGGLSTVEGPVGTGHDLGQAHQAV
jgi:hypothetical protein